MLSPNCSHTKAKCLSHTDKTSRLFSYGDGAYLYSGFGERYLDFNQAMGSAILGHDNNSVSNKIHRTPLINGGCEHIDELEVRLRTLYPWMNSFVLASSGTEACQRAIRLCRALTGKTKIAIVDGSWHGNSDYTLIRRNESQIESSSCRSISSGIPQQVMQTMCVLPRNDPSAVRSLAKDANVAAIIVETIQGAYPLEYNSEFIREINNLRDSGIIVVADEIITGIRCRNFMYSDPCLNLKADMFLFGKTIARGAPIGLVGVSENSHIVADIHDVIKEVFLGGTFSGNPYTVSAMLELIDMKEVIREKREEMILLAERLRSETNEILTALNAPIRIIGYESISRIISHDDKISDRETRDKFEDSAYLDKLRNYLLSKNIYYSKNGLIFVSGGHDDDHISRFADGVRDFIAMR